MHVTYSTESTPGRPNEDFVAAGPTWVVLLDGATAPAEVDSGCIHNVPWLVRHLGAELVTSLTRDTERTLPEVLACALVQVRAAHAGTCDLSNPDSPSSTVVLARWDEKTLDYLVLADSPLVLCTDTGVRAVVDDRSAHLPDYSYAGVRAARNRAGGFWVASTNPDAAFKAVVGSEPVETVRAVALLTDGASRWVERFSLGGWPELMHLTETAGPEELIRQVRDAENHETATERSRHRGKHHDDATAVLVTL